MRSASILSCALVLLALAPSTRAQTYAGSTAGGLRWGRPSTVGNGTSGSCSIGATDTALQFALLHIPTTGSYTITATWQGFDGYLHLYSGPFGTGDPCVNLVALDDDFNGIGQSQIVHTLNAGTGYRVVHTGFDNGDAGAYSVTITGPSSVGSTVYSEHVGTTAGYPLWQRPSSVGSGTSGSCSLSGSATAVPFQFTAITPVTSGTYTVRADWQGFDGYLLLYRGDVSSADQCRNLIALNDDAGGIGASEFSVGLTAGTTYYIVHTGFSNADAGAYYGQMYGAGGTPVAGESTPEAIAGFRLGAVVPQPVDGRSEMLLTVEVPQHVSVEMFDAAGRRVAVLQDAMLAAGAHAIRVDGSSFAAGLYLVRATGAEGVQVQRVVITR